MPPAGSASSTPGPLGAKNLVGDALYSWCREEQDYGYVFQQDELLDSNIIPNRDLMILLTATQYLVGRHLLKIHDVKGQEGAAWELIAPEIAKRASELQEYGQRQSKPDLSAHAKVLDRVYKSLEGRNLIKQMKSVKNPGRKLYILWGLQPSEEATGGAWFTEGRLDTEMIDAISGFVEMYCSDKSWREADEDEDTFDTSRKRKKPDDGFDTTGKGKGKAVKVQHESQEDNTETSSKNAKQKPQPRYEPHEAGYTGYPTVRDVSKALLASNVMESGQALPETALSQLLDVMVYDDRLFKMSRPLRGGEMPDAPDKKEVTMYRCFKPLDVIRKENTMRSRLEHGSRTARRIQELEDIGRGGTSEVPCMGCPNFDICGEGGPVNADTCVYFEDWYKRMEDADREIDDPWPLAKKPVKPNPTASTHR